MDIAITTARNRITDALLNGNESVSYRDIEAASMPVFVKAWFHLGVETWYLPEYAHRAAWTHFDYADALVQQTQAEYDRAVKGTARFSREACEEIIDGALRHEMAYVKQPVDAVIGILLQRSDAVDGVHVVDFLSQFKREDFYSASLRTYVSEHEDSHLDQELLKQILLNAERQAYETRPYETFRAAVGAVADMLGIITGNDRADQISGGVWSFFIEFRQIHQLNPVLGETLARLNLQTEQSLTPDELLGTESPPPDMEALSSPEESDAEDPVAPVYDIPETYKALEEPVDPVEQDTAFDLLENDRLEPWQESSGLSGGEVSNDDSVKDVTHIEPNQIDRTEDDSESEGLDEEVVNDYLNEGNTSGNLNEEPPAIYESSDDSLETPGISANDSEEETEVPLGDLEDEVDTPAGAEQESVEETQDIPQDSPIADNMEALASPNESDPGDTAASEDELTEVYCTGEERGDPAEQDTAFDLVQDDRLEPSEEPSVLSGSDVPDDASEKDLSHIECDENDRAEDDNESELVDEKVVDDYANVDNTSDDLNGDLPLTYDSSDDSLETPAISADDFEDETDTPATEPETVEETQDMPEDSPIAPIMDESVADEQEQGEEKEEMVHVEEVAITNTPIANSPIKSSLPPMEISKKQEKLFVKKLFNKNLEEYQEVLSRLEFSVSWEEAFKIIEEIWQERGLNLFSKESQDFTGVFYKRYFPPSEGLRRW